MSHAAESNVCPVCKDPMSLHYKGYTGRFMCFERNSYENNDFCGCTHGAPIPDEMFLYAIRSEDKKYYRPKAGSSYRDIWVDDLCDAKFYVKVGQARSRITAAANGTLEGERRGKISIPELIEFKVTEVRVIDETSRVKETKRKKEIRKAQLKEDRAKRELDEAAEQLAAAQARFELLRRGR